MVGIEPSQLHRLRKFVNERHISLVGIEPSQLHRLHALFSFTYCFHTCAFIFDRLIQSQLAYIWINLQKSF